MTGLKKTNTAERGLLEIVQDIRRTSQHVPATYEGVAAQVTIHRLCDELEEQISAMQNEHARMDSCFDLIGLHLNPPQIQEEVGK